MTDQPHQPQPAPNQPRGPVGTTSPTSPAPYIGGGGWGLVAEDEGARSTSPPGLPYAVLARRPCGCITRLALIERRDDAERIRRGWAGEGLVVRACHLEHARLSVCREHQR